MTDRLSAAAEKVKDLMKKFYATPRYLPAPTQMQINALVDIVSHKVQDAEKAAAETGREEKLLGIVAWRRDLLEAWRTDSRAWMTALLEGGPNMDIEKTRASEDK